MNLYSEIILDHYKNPHNKGKLKHPTASVKEENTFCGDELQLDILTDKQGKVEQIKFSGHGCAISQASASMLTDKLIGKTLKQIEKIKNEDIFKLLNIPISPGRVKCALLSLIAAKKAAIIAKHKIN